jgi:L-fuconolactonase
MSDSATYVDGHVHFWDPDRFHYRWLRGDPHLDRPFLPEHLDAAPGPAGIVVVQADCLPSESAGEVAWFHDLASRGAPVAAIVAHVALEEPAAGARLDELARTPLVTGVRRLLQDEPAGFARRPEFVAGVRLLARHGMTMDLCVRHHQIAEATALVRDVPEVVFVLDHLGKPRVTSAPAEAWKHDLRGLAALPNVCCKLSGLATEAEEPRADHMLPYLRFALEVFGPDRCLFGSDWPVLTPVMAHGRWREVVLEAIADLTAPEQHHVMAETASAVYRTARGRLPPRRPWWPPR